MKQASPKTVGVFVIGAITILVVAVVVFGSGRIFHTQVRHVAFFKDSLIGLQVGAPVQFRGIPIGSVVEIFAEIDPETGEHWAPVVFDIDVDKVRGAQESDIDLDEILVVEKGMRARLTLQSLVTGQQIVEIDFFPDSPLNMVETSLPYSQIPTIPGTFGKLQRGIDALAERGVVVLQRIEELLSDENLEYVSNSLANVSEITDEVNVATDDAGPLMKEARGAVQNLDDAISEARDRTRLLPQAIENISTTLDSYKGLAEEGTEILEENRPEIKELIAGLNVTREKVDRVADLINDMLAENRQGIRDFSNEGLYEITNLAVDLQGATEQFRRVLEELERDPARFLLGKPGTVEVE